MSKRLSFSDYLFTLVFIFMLACIVGAFFFGVQVGKGQVNERVEELLILHGADSNLDGYHQQHLVSFYHTVFLPYREFQKNWFDTIRTIEQRSHTARPNALLRELSDIADKQYNEIKEIPTFESSPLLASAHKQYIQSLKLFADKAKEIKAGNNTGIELVRIIDLDPFLQEAKHYALLAQRDFYRAIVKWNEGIQPLPETTLLSKETMGLEDWNSLNFNLKNSYIAAWLAAQRNYEHFFPQDLVVRIDEMIASGQAEKLNLASIEEISQTLIDTRAVRYGDFLESKSRFYEKEVMPQLPFFSLQN